MSETSTDTRQWKMDNGATVADWLGTAATAAQVAAMYLKDVRNGVAGASKLIAAREQLAQALEETDAILARLDDEAETVVPSRPDWDPDGDCPGFDR